MGVVEIGTYYNESTGVHFWAGGDGLDEMLQQVAFPAMLSNSNGFSAGKVLSLALDLATLLWANLRCYELVHFEVVHVSTIWQILTSCDLLFGNL